MPRSAGGYSAPQGRSNGTIYLTLARQGYGFLLRRAPIAVGISLMPLNFRPGIAPGILKVAGMVIANLLLTNVRPSGLVLYLINAFVGASFYASVFGWYKILTPHKPTSKLAAFLAVAKGFGFSLGLISALTFVIMCATLIWSVSKDRNRIACCCLRVIAASGLACLPLLQLEKLGSKYKFISIPVPVALYSLGCPALKDLPSYLEYLENIDSPNHISFRPESREVNNALLLSTSELISRIIERLMPVLFFWSVVSPFPGISLRISFYILFSSLAAALVGNLQIPVAMLQVLLSGMRLHSLVGHHHRAYDPLPEGATTSLVPSVVVFYVLEMCQGSAYILGIILGIFSFRCRISLLRALELSKEDELEWGPKAVNLYQHHVYEARTARGLFPTEKFRPPSIHRFAVESLGSTSSEMNIIRLHVLHHHLHHKESEPKKKIITEIAKDAKDIITKIIEIISALVTELSENSGEDTEAEHSEDSLSLGITDLLENRGEESLSLSAESVRTAITDSSLENSGEETLYLSMESMISPAITNSSENSGEESLYETARSHIIENGDEDREAKHKSLCLCVEILRGLAMTAGKFGANCRQELLENPLFQNSLEYIWDLNDSRSKPLEPVMDIIAMLALDEAGRHQIGSSQAIIGRFMGAFPSPDEVRHEVSHNNGSLIKAAVKALTNLTTLSPDNCWAILKADLGHHLINNLVTMLEDEDESAANLLHNLCANSGDMLIELGVKEDDLISALQKVMKTIKTTERDKQLEAALLVASQIGHVIPEHFANEIDEQFVEKLMVTLRSKRKPSPECPRIRRALIELVISIVRLCPDRYTRMFREQGVEDALDMVKGKSSRLEKCMVFIGGEGIVLESSPLHDLVDQAKKLFSTDEATQGAQQGRRA